MPLILIMGVFLFFSTGFFICPGNKALAGLADHAVVNEVHIDSVAGTGGTDDDWVELYNPTSQAVTLDGWSIQKSAGTGSSLYREALNGSIAAGGYYLIVRNGATTAQNLKDAADLLASDSFSLASGNIVYVVNDNVNISGAADPNIVDFIGFGTASYFEGTAAAPAIAETKSISRSPDGEDTNQNSIDFILLDTPTPTNSQTETGNEIGGTVLLTVTPDAVPVRNISGSGADIVLSVNAGGLAQVNYGLTSAYGNSTAAEPVVENTAKTISISGLICNTVYHYAVYAESTDGAESDTTADATFTTLPCGISLDSMVMAKTGAKANAQYADGWVWEFDLTVWSMGETSLKMKFNTWTGTAGTLSAGGNMQYSANSGATWTDITTDNAYPVVGADVSAIDLSANAGRQVKVLVRMKVPTGTSVGYYTSSYGILTE